MYDPEKLEEYAQNIYDRCEYFNNYTLETIGRRIKAASQLSAYDAQALKNIADVSGDMKKITERLAEITEMNIADIEKVYMQVGTDCVNISKPLYDFKGMKLVPFEENEYAQILVKNWAVRTAGDIVNLSRTKALCFDKYDAFGNVTGSTPLQGAFEQAMSEAVQAVSLGTVDFNTAMAKTVERLGGSGVKVNYGNGVTRNLSSAMRQNILWGAKQSTNAYEEHVSNELGLDGFEVDAHAGCRPSHLFMQGKSYSLSGTKTIKGVTYEDGTEALARLEDYGCLHYKRGVLLGVSQPSYTRAELNRIYRESTELIEYNGKQKTLYEWKQTQRRFERETKKAAQQSNMFKTAGNKSEAKKYADRAAEYRNVYKDMCGSIKGLELRLDRMKVYKDKSLTSGVYGGKINKKSRVSTGGLRNEVPLTRMQIEENKSYAIMLGMPKEKIRYGDHYNTAYGSEFDMLYIGTDVYPTKLNIKSANSLISNKGAIAHEIVGHREPFLKGLEQENGVLDEIQASIRAARFAPGLTENERYILIRDAVERARNNGYKMKNIKRLLHIQER